MSYHLYKSDKPDKKFYVIPPDSNNKIYFGSSAYEDYTIHKDLHRRKLYDTRHRRRENWRNPRTAGFWSKFILWNQPTIQESIKFTENKFKIKILYHTGI